MSRNSIFFFSGLLVIILISIYFGYTKIFLKEEFQIFTQEDEIPDFNDFFKLIK